ncbi:MAG: response regulator [Rhodothermales bacterium]
MMRTILVIEDDADVRDNIQDLLTSDDYVVIPVADGRAGLKEAHFRQPDLIICDVMMPDIDGYEVLRELRQQPETMSIPFVFVTAKASRSAQRIGMNLGADDYLVKPFTSEELLNTVHARLERHEERSYRYQERLEELRSNLSRTLPHELRTPLSCILGFSEFLLQIYDTVEPDELRSMLEDINVSAKRLERLIENYYLYAQLEVSATDPAWRAAMLNQGACAVEPVVERVAAARAESHARPEDLHLDIAQGQARIQGAYLEKIVEELVDNAFKFSGPGTPVSVTGLRDKDYYVLQVTDEGRGITDEQLQQVGAFVQFDRKKYEQQGLGLGLAIARRLTALHQGMLDIDSVLDKGTSVWVWLPLAG